MQTILVVEDDPALSRLYDDILSIKGYKVLTANNGTTGLSIAKEKNVDLILLDMVLPQMKGLEVLAKLMDDVSTDTIPVVILTNSANEDDRVQAFELGAKDYLVKAKQSPEDVVAIVKKYLPEE